MFSGIGGFELGIGDRGLCIGYSEIDKHAITTYEEHYEHQNYGDATTIDERQLPDFDLLVGGFPCQAFSIAGKRRGFLDETRGTLFFDIARVLTHKRPSHFVLENVKGLLSHDSGKTFTTILGVLTDLGYRVEWQVLNSKDFGVPQNRERVYFIGHLRDECAGQVLPIAGDSNEVSQEYIGSHGTPRLPDQTHLSRAHKQPARVFATTGISPTISAQESSGRYNIMVAGNIWGGVSGRVYDSRGISPTLSTAITGGLQQPKIIEGVKVRRLTPVECERLQGFGDNWSVGTDAQRYKQTGNAVTVNVVEAVITAMCHEGCLQVGGIS
jgi:DNA (cytosine-5)-methyltransferase 1